MRNFVRRAVARVGAPAGSHTGRENDGDRADDEQSHVFRQQVARPPWLSKVAREGGRGEEGERERVY